MTRSAPLVEPSQRPFPGRRRLVVGCGPLGIRVARRWLAAGDRVWGITRSRCQPLAAAGIEPIEADVTARFQPLLPEVDTVVWSVGFDRRSGCSPHDLHVAGLQRLLDRLSPAVRVVFSSSTGVWSGGHGELVDETTPVSPSRPATVALVEAEDLLRRHPRGPGIALRFAGLYGPERLPRLEAIRHGEPVEADPHSWLNLIHLDDAADVVCLAADSAMAGPLYVVSDGTPIQRAAWYQRLAELTGSPPATFRAPSVSDRGGNKRVDSTRLMHDLRPQLSYPDALACLPRVLAEAAT
jgi:nucleoside-diphosphate-sugar epimerase